MRRRSSQRGPRPETVSAVVGVFPWSRPRRTRGTGPVHPRHALRQLDPVLQGRAKLTNSVGFLRECGVRVLLGDDGLTASVSNPGNPCFAEDAAGFVSHRYLAA